MQDGSDAIQGPGIADVLWCDEPPDGGLPLVFDSPHSGMDFPKGFTPAAPRAAWMSSVDLHVERLFAGAPRHGAGLLAIRVPRCLIDVNREVDDIDPDLLAGPWPTPLNPGEKSRLGLGLIRRWALPGVAMHAGPLPVATLERWIEAYWRPYHAALAAMLEARHARFGGVWHVNCHSMKSVANAMTVDAGATRPDIVLGDRDGTACDPAFTGFVADFLAARGYRVAVNHPYKGAALVARNGDPARGRHSLLLEINRRLYLDEAAFVPNDGYPRLQRDLDALIAALAGQVAAWLPR